MYKNIFLIILLIIIIAIAYLLFFNNPKPNTISLDLKGQNFQLEVAKTIPQKTRGLMNRTSLCQNCGMIFVSDYDQPQIFWMKDTLIPLDMIFVDHTGKVTNIETAVPEPNTPDNKIKFYKSTSPAQYVIELAGGTASKINLISGDILTIDVKN